MDSQTYTGLTLANALVTTAVVGGGAWLWMSQSKNKKQAPLGTTEAPSPPGHWLLGHIPQIAVPDYHRQYVKWADELGPVYRLWIGKTAYVVADASLAAPLLARGPDYLPKIPEVYQQSLWLSFDRPSIFNEHNDNDPTWRRVRKAAASSFAVEHIKKIFPQILIKADKMMSSWNKMLAPGPEGDSTEAVVEVVEWSKRCVMDSMLFSAFKYHSNALDDDLHNFDNEFLHVLHLLLEELSLRFVDPFRATKQKMMPFLKSTRQFNAMNARYREMIGTIWDQIQSQGSPKPDDYTLAAALQRLLEPSVDGPPLSKNDVLGNLSILIIGSFDTSASAVSWALYNIASRPDVQQRCIKELHAASLLHVKGQPAPRPLAWDDIHGLPYLQATVKESMRYSTIAAGGAAREAQHDMAIGKYWVPKGSWVLIPLACFHESKHNFSDARTFDPTRWLASEQGKEEVTSGKAASHPTPYGNAANIQKSYLPFSTGPRDCVGQSLANVTLRTMIMSILSRFHLSVHPDTGTPEEVEKDQSC